MQLDKIVFYHKAVIVFAKAELRVLNTLAEHHYDGNCQAMAKQGGTIYGLLNTFEADEKAEFAESWPMTFREVDLLCKICEMAVYPHGGADVSLGVELGSELHRVLRKMNEMSEKAAGREQ